MRTRASLSALLRDMARPPFVGLAIVSGDAFRYPAIASDVVAKFGGDVNTDEDDESEESRRWNDMVGLRSRVLYLDIHDEWC